MKQRPLKIAVVSDNHIDTKVEPDSWELAKAAFNKVAVAKVDHVVIAGDLFDCATAMHRDRDQVERLLRRLGLWHRDRLSIVVGNHDIFHTPHHGSNVERLWEAKNIATAAGQKNYDAFAEWAGGLVSARDRLDDEDLYPFEKRLGDLRLWAADTTSGVTATSGNGFWPDVDDTLLRRASKRNWDGERRVLAMHNTPIEDELQTITNFLKGEYSYGFPPPELSRLQEFTDDAEVDAIVCGHVHWTGDRHWNWRIGDAWRCDVHMVGRTGGVHGARPCFGLLEVPSVGRLKWKTVRV